MAWSTNFQPIRESDSLDLFLLIAGKALYLATTFEKRCQYVLRTAKIDEHYLQTSDASSVWHLVETLKDPLLGPTIKELRTYLQVSSDEIEILTRAKDARNFVAHELTDLGPLNSLELVRLQEKTAQLQSELPSLIAGDCLVTKWLYRLEETEYQSKLVQEFYPSWVTEWVIPTRTT